MKSVKTNTYVWGEGYQVDATMEFSNYTPKKIRQFEGADTPNVVDMAFGWYHEAYIDSEGKLYVGDKVKMSSIKIAEIPDGVRNLTEVTTLPKKTKVRQVVFTRRRMFVVSECGKLFSFVIQEEQPSADDFLLKSKPQFTGKLLLDNPIQVPDIPPIKMAAAGLDHALILDRKGQVYAMGDDTFGQCGQGGDKR